MTELIVIQSTDQLEQWLQQSFTKPLFIYKHSTQCGSSRSAHQAIHHFIARFPHLSSRFLFTVVRVLEEKGVSDQVTLQLGVAHLSPQILLVHQGRAIWHASHQQINSNYLSGVASHFLKSLPS